MKRLTKKQLEQVVEFRDKAFAFAKEIADAVGCSSEGTEREFTCPRCHGRGETTGGYENGDIVVCPTTRSHSGTCRTARGAEPHQMCAPCRAFSHATSLNLALVDILANEAQEEQRIKREEEDKRRALADAEATVAKIREELKEAERARDELAAARAAS